MKLLFSCRPLAVLWYNVEWNEKEGLNHLNTSSSYVTAPTAAFAAVAAAAATKKEEIGVN